MSPLFLQHYAHFKVAGPVTNLIGKALRVPEAVLSNPEIVQPLAGATGGAIISAGESAANPHMTNTGKEVNLGVNMAMGGILGSPRLRRSHLLSSFQKTPGADGGVVEKYGPDIKKWIGVNSLWGAKALGLNTWDSVNQSLQNAAGASRGLQTTVDDIRENVLGLKPGETQMDASARHALDAYLTERGPVPHFDPKVPFGQALERAWKNYQSSNQVTPAIQSKFQAMRDRMTQYMQDDMNYRDVSRQISNIGSAVDKVTDPATLKPVTDAYHSVTDQLSNFSDPSKANPVMARIDKLNQNLEPVGNFARWLPEHMPSGKQVAIGAGAAAAGAGAFTLLRDYLNARAVRKEREARTAPKVAGFGSWLLRRGLPGAAVGGAEGYMNYELDPGHPATAAMGGVIGAVGGSNIFHGAHGFTLNPKAFYGIGGGALIPRALTAITGAAKNQQAELGARPLQTGAAIAGGAGLLYLINKQINKPTPDPVTNVNVDAPVNVTGGGGGGGGRPDAPGMGTLTLQLPKRHDRDHQTSVAIPLENLELPKTYYSRIKRDTKRQLRAETDDRTMHRLAPKLATLLNLFA